MLIGTITAVDDWYPTRYSEFINGAFKLVTHDDHVTVTTEDSGCIVKRFALGDGGSLHLCCFSDLTAKQVPGAAKTYPCTGAGFEEHVSEYCALKNAGDALTVGVGKHLVSNLEYRPDSLTVKLGNGENMATNKIQSAIMSDQA